MLLVFGTTFLDFIFKSKFLLLICWFNSSVYAFQFVEVELGLEVLIDPYVAHLHDWSELPSLELVQIMPKVIGTLNKLRLVRLDRQLHLYHHLTPLQQIHKYILNATVQPILHSNNFDT